MSAIPTNAAFQKITSNNITDDYVQLIRGSDKSVLLWVDALGVIHAPNSFTTDPGGATTNVQINNGGAFYGDGNFTYNFSTVPQITMAGLSVANLDSNIFGTIIPQTASLTVAGILNGAAGPQYPIKVMGQATNSAITSGVYVTTLAKGSVNSLMGAVEANNYTEPTIAATFNLAASVIGYTENDGPGTVTELTGMYSQTGSVGGTTIRASAFAALTPFVNTGTVHNNFGFHSQTQSSIGDTLNAAFHADDQGTNATSFAFYSAGGQNYFGGTQTTKVVQITNPTSATSLVNQSSPFLGLSGTYWNGSASATNLWTLQDVTSAGANPVRTLTLTGGSSSGGQLFHVLTAFTADGLVNFGANVAIPNGFLQIAPVNAPCIKFRGNTPATGGSNTSSGQQLLYGSYWTGSAAADDIWTFQNVLGAGANPTSNFLFTHSGTSGAANVSVPGLIVSGNSAIFGTAGATSGILTLEGSTSGAATITAPATAGVVTNPIAFSNAIGLGTFPAGVYSTVAGALGGGYNGAANLAVGDGTNARRVPMTLFTGYSFAATGNVTSFTSLFATPTGSNGSLTLVANQQTVGSTIHIRTIGTVTVSTATQSCFFKVMLNGGVCDEPGVSLTTAATSWELDSYIYCAAVGTSGVATMQTTTIVKFYTGSAFNANNTPSVTSLSSTVNTTGTQLIDLQFAFGASEVGNTMSLLSSTVTLE